MDNPLPIIAFRIEMLQCSRRVNRPELNLYGVQRRDATIGIYAVDGQTFD
jgi:hypothetical protein